MRVPIHSIGISAIFLVFFGLSLGGCANDDKTAAATDTGSGALQDGSGSSGAGSTTTGSDGAAAQSPECTTTGTPVPTFCEGIPITHPCVVCMTDHCKTEMEAAMGTAWTQKTPGGACSAMFQCELDCGCTESCVTGCEAAPTAACKPARDAFAACLMKQPCAANCGTATVCAASATDQ